MSDLGDWFRSIPLITRYWFAGSIAVPLVGKLGLVSPVNLFLWPDAFIHRFQIWRPITATFFFPVGPGTGFLYLVNLYFLYQYSSRLETGAFDGRPADYMFMLLFNWICIVITGLVMDMQLLMIPLIMSVLYVWAQLNRDMIVSFWFGTRFKACYLPWVILGFNYIIGGSVINELIGNLVGHLYFFLMFKYPMDLGGRNFLSTPQFLFKCMVEDINQHLSTRDWGSCPGRAVPSRLLAAGLCQDRPCPPWCQQQLWGCRAVGGARCQQRFHGVDRSPRPCPRWLPCTHNVPIVPRRWLPPRNAATVAVFIKNKACFQCPAPAATLKQPLWAPGLL